VYDLLRLTPNFWLSKEQSEEKGMKVFLSEKMLRFAKEFEKDLKALHPLSKLTGNSAENQEQSSFPNL